MKLSSYLIVSWILYPASIFVGASGGHCVPNKWESSSNLKMMYIEVSADNNHHWGISPTGDVYYRALGNDWQNVPIPNDQMGFLHISVSGDGDIIWGITGKGNDIYREGGINGDWFLVVDNAKNWIDVSVSADGTRVLGIDEAGGVWDREGIQDKWSKRSGNDQSMDGTLMVASYTENGEIGWAVDFNHNVFYRGGFEKKWTMVTGKLKFIAVSADGNHVWGTNSHDIIFYRNGKHDFWKGMPGRAKQITVSGDGDHVYGVNRNDDVFYINGYPGFFQYDRKATVDVGHSLKEVSVSGSGNEIYGVDTQNRLWHTRGIGDPWRPITGEAKSVSVVSEHELWAVTPGDSVIWREDENLSFKTLSGTITYLEGSSDGKHVWGVNSGHIMFHRPGKQGGGLPSFWDPIPGSSNRAKQISVSSDGSHVWYVNRNNDIFYRNGKNGPQQSVPGPKLKQIAVSGDGNHVWGVNDDQQLYYRAGYGGTWIEAEGPLVDYVSLNDDGEVMYATNTVTGTTYYRFC